MIRNKLEIRVCGLQRSGNHAVIDWIINQHKGARVCFLNNVCHGDRNPFYTAIIFVYGMKEFSNGYLPKLPKNLQYLNKELLIYSYEDDERYLQNEHSFLSSVYCKDFEKNKYFYLGKSTKFIDVIIIRDPYNFFASRLKKMNSLSGIKNIEKIIAFWKEIANKAIEIEENRESKTLLINYNKWLSNKQYRQQLSKSLCGKFTDTSMKKMSIIGGGSSFEETVFIDLSFKKFFTNFYKILQIETYKKITQYCEILQKVYRQQMKAKQNKFFDRWKEIKNDSRMQNILQDPEILDLSKKLFDDFF